MSPSFFCVGGKTTSDKDSRDVIVLLVVYCTILLAVNGGHVEAVEELSAAKADVDLRAGVFRHLDLAQRAFRLLGVLKHLID